MNPEGNLFRVLCFFIELAILILYIKHSLLGCYEKLFFVVVTLFMRCSRCGL